MEGVGKGWQDRRDGEVEVEKGRKGVEGIRKGWSRYRKDGGLEIKTTFLSTCYRYLCEDIWYGRPRV